MHLLPGYSQEVCYGDQSMISCDSNEVILMTSAEYGHMAVGRCVKQEDPRYLGCKSGVMPLFDTWCSGKRECNFDTRDEELERLNINCPQFTLKYIQLQYDCIEGTRVFTSEQNDTTIYFNIVGI